MVKKINTNFGVVSFICGLLGLIFCWVPFIGLILSILGIVFYSRQKKIQQTGLATAGLVLGILGTIGGAIYILIFISAIIMTWGAAFSQGMAQV